MIEKALNMELTVKDGIFYAEPTTERKLVYKHKITVDEKTGIPKCGCHAYRVFFKKHGKLCSHALAVLGRIKKSSFWHEVSRTK